VRVLNCFVACTNWVVKMILIVCFSFNFYVPYSTPISRLRAHTLTKGTVHLN